MYKVLRNMYTTDTHIDLKKFKVFALGEWFYFKMSLMSCKFFETFKNFCLENCETIQKWECFIYLKLKWERCVSAGKMYKLSNKFVVNKYLEFTSMKDTYTSRKEENSFVFF